MHVNIGYHSVCGCNASNGAKKNLVNCTESARGAVVWPKVYTESGSVSVKEQRKGNPLINERAGGPWKVIVRKPGDVGSVLIVKRVLYPLTKFDVNLPLIDHALFSRCSTTLLR